MVTKVLKAGMEVDAYCTRCKLDLAHRIVNMDGDRVGKVECRTCYGHHQYRRPKSEPEPIRATSREPRAERKASPGVRALAAATAERTRRQEWEARVLGRPVTSFKPYRPTAVFAAGDVVHHAKFGDGWVVRVIDASKIEIMFADAPRTLAQGLD